MLKKIKLRGEQKKVLFLPSKNPIQIKGAAGSGKTTVALYRAKHLLETQNTLFKESNIIIFTFNKTLAAYISAVIPSIDGGYQKDTDVVNPRSKEGLNVAVVNFHKWAYDFASISRNTTVMQREQTHIISKVKATLNSSESNILDKSIEFFRDEISWIKGKNLTSRTKYLEAQRTGRGTADRVTAKDKEVIWDLYEGYNQELKNRGKVDFDDYALLCLEKIKNDPLWDPPYTHVIVDEAQDLNKAQILVISKLVSKDTESITIIADAAQRIYKSGFTWSEVGINVRGGRTIELKKNYRNTAQIARAALSLLDKETDKSEFTQVEVVDRQNGEKPVLAVFEGFNKQLEYLKEQLLELQDSGQLGSTVVLHRVNASVNEISRYLENNNLQVELLKTNMPVDYLNNKIKICTMSSIKGLEFDNVFILDLTDDIIPSPLGFNDDDDEFHTSTERRLLYTCMTRARRKLYLIGATDNPSRYLKEIDPELVDCITGSIW